MFGGKVLFLCLMCFWFVCLFVNLNVIWLFLCITELFFNDNLVATWNITIVFILLFLKFPFLYSLLIVLYYRRRFSVHYILQAEYMPQNISLLSLFSLHPSHWSLCFHFFSMFCASKYEFKIQTMTQMGRSSFITGSSPRFQTLFYYFTTASYKSWSLISNTWSFCLYYNLSLLSMIKCFSLGHQNNHRKSDIMTAVCGSILMWLDTWNNRKSSGFLKLVCSGSTKMHI